MRPNQFGNPFKIEDHGPLEAVRLFRESLTPEMCALIREKLAGWDLGCTCPLGTPCHADVLLEIANQDPSAPKGRPTKSYRAKQRKMTKPKRSRKEIEAMHRERKEARKIAARMIFEGRSLKEIAVAVNRSPQTIKDWRSNGSLEGLLAQVEVEAERPQPVRDSKAYFEEAARRRFGRLPTIEEIMNGSRCRHGRPS